MDTRRQQQSSTGIAILSMVLTVPALLYILSAIAFQFYKAVTGFTGPYPLLNLGVPQQLVTRLFVLYLVCGPLFGCLLSVALRSESRSRKHHGACPLWTSAPAEHGGLDAFRSDDWSPRARHCRPCLRRIIPVAPCFQHTPACDRRIDHAGKWMGLCGPLSPGSAGSKEKFKPVHHRIPGLFLRRRFYEAPLAQTSGGR